MGYYANGSGDIRIAEEKCEASLQALKEAPKKGYWDPSRYAEFDSLQKLLNDLGFDASSYDGFLRMEIFDSKSHDEEDVFEVLAPFVEAGSKFEWSGEDDTHWRWRFDGSSMRVDYGQITYADEATDSNVSGLSNVALDEIAAAFSGVETGHQLVDAVAKVMRTLRRTGRTVEWAFPKAEKSTTEGT